MNMLLEIGPTNALIATILAVIVAIVTRFWRHPSIMHALWIIVLVKLVTPPLVAISWQWPNTRTASHTVVETFSATPTSILADQFGEPTMPAPVAISAPHENGMAVHASEFVAPPIAESELISMVEPAITTPGLADTSIPTPTNWSFFVFWLWLCGSVLCLLVAAARLIGFHRALLQTAPAADDLDKLARSVAKTLGVVRPFRLRMTAGRLAPLVWPVGRPTIVLSQPLVEQLSHEEIRMLLAHELAHLRRKDHWVRWLELSVTILYWWHPVVWLARTRIHRAEEQLCDAWTVWAFPESARHYAEALFKAVQFTSENRRAVPIVASRLSAGGDLKERIEHIMNATWNHRLGWPGAVGILFAALVVLPLSLQGEQPSSNDSEVAKSAVLQNDPLTQPATTTAVQFREVQEEVVAADGSRRIQIREVPATVDMAQAKSAPVLAVPTGPALPNPPAAPGPSAEMLSTWHEQIKFLEMQLERSKALLEVGAEGGSREDYELAAYELARAQSEMALAERKFAEAIEKNELAVKHAEAALQALDARRSAGQASAESVFQAARKLYDARRSLLQLRGDAVRRASQRSSTWVPPVDVYRISPGDAIRVSALGVAADAPIEHEYYVEPSGTIALGVQYGRVKVSALTLEEAEKAIGDHLKKTFPAVQVQVTLPRPRLLQSAQATPEVANPTQTSDASRPAAATDHVSLIGAPDNRVDIARELNQLGQSSQSPDSIGVLKTIVEAKKRELDLIKPLAEKAQVSKTELAAKQAEYEISKARLRQGERGLQYRDLLVKLAELELDRAMEANKTTPNSVSQTEMRRLQILVELAKVKFAELAE